MSCHFETCSVTMDSMLMSDEEHFHRRGLPWPVRSPNLTVPYFFLLGPLKERVYRNRPHTIQELKRAIRDEIAAINKELLRRLFGSFVDRLRLCCK
jgi:hypothetical protein